MAANDDAHCSSLFDPADIFLINYFNILLKITTVWTPTTHRASTTNTRLMDIKQNKEHLKGTQHIQQ